MELETLKDLYIHELKDLYRAENQLLKALPKRQRPPAMANLPKGLRIVSAKQGSTRPGWKRRALCTNSTRRHVPKNYN